MVALHVARAIPCSLRATRVLAVIGHLATEHPLVRPRDWSFLRAPSILRSVVPKLSGVRSA
eukprot:1206894-Lingulodinium_polyedra.AAC.1